MKISLKKCLRSRRGVAIEMAIAMMMIVFALCSLIVTVSYIVKTRETRGVNDLAKQVEIDQIGENFVDSDDRKNFVLQEEMTDRYEVEFSTNDDHRECLKVYNADKTQPKLWVEVGEDGKIVRWSYSFEIVTEEENNDAKESND